jgi:hypothetical protein
MLGQLDYMDTAQHNTAGKRLVLAFWNTDVCGMLILNLILQNEHSGKSSVVSKVRKSEFLDQMKVWLITEDPVLWS